MTDELWLEQSTGRIVQVLAREKTPNGLTLFEYVDTGERAERRHPDFAREFAPL